MTRADKFALLLSVLGAIAAYLVADRVFERMAHIEDEMAFVWQAQVIAEGKLSLPSPEHPESFLVPFVVDHNDQRFAKYPLGWPAMLSIGIRLGLRAWVNPMLAGLGIWLTYRLGKRTLGEVVGLLAAGLTMLSPFFLMNSGSLLSHPFGLVLSAAFALAWIDGFGDSRSEVRWLATITAGLSLGLLALTRPLTALGVGLPFGLHGLYLLLCGDQRVRGQVLTVGGSALLLGCALFLWQFAVTDDPLLNPYTLWWPYDKVGFGEGFGRFDHNLALAWKNTTHSLKVGWSDLFGWGRVSWLFLPFGLWAIRRERRAWAVASVFPMLVILHMAYWIGAWVYGPRYYYEGLYSLTILSAVGIAWLAGWPTKAMSTPQLVTGWRRALPLGVTGVLALLTALSLFFYLPIRLGGMQGLHGIERANLRSFQGEFVDNFAPALIIVHPEIWTEYGVLLELQDAFLDDPIIFAITRNRFNDAAVKEAFADSERRIFHYYTDEPGVLYTDTRPARP